MDDFYIVLKIGALAWVVFDGGRSLCEVALDSLFG